MLVTSCLLKCHRPCRMALPLLGEDNLEINFLLSLLCFKSAKTEKASLIYLKISRYTPWIKNARVQAFGLDVVISIIDLAACPSLGNSWPESLPGRFVRHGFSATSGRVELIWAIFFQKNLQEEIDALESRVEAIQRVLADLKVQLYAKFGSNINLEADES